MDSPNLGGAESEDETPNFMAVGGAHIRASTLPKRQANDGSHVTGGERNLMAHSKAGATHRGGATAKAHRGKANAKAFSTSNEAAELAQPRGPLSSAFDGAMSEDDAPMPTSATPQAKAGTGNTKGERRARPLSTARGKPLGKQKAKASASSNGTEGADDRCVEACQATLRDAPAIGGAGKAITAPSKGTLKVTSKRGRILRSDATLLKEREQRLPVAKPIPMMGSMCVGLVVLEVYAGCARLTGACAEFGLSIGPPIDILNGNELDTRNPHVQSCILSWILAGLVWYVHIAPQCTWASIARRRSRKPADMSTMWFTVLVLRAAREAKIFFSIENPVSSHLWHVPAIAKLLEGAIAVTYDCCAFGANYLKRTTLRTNCHALVALAKRCHDVPMPHEHETLEGKVAIPCAGKLAYFWKTSLAGKYPPALCREWAGLLRKIAPPNAIARPGAALLSAHWRQWLLDAVGEANVNCDPIPVPTCPMHFVSGPRHASCAYTLFPVSCILNEHACLTLAQYQQARLA